MKINLHKNKENFGKIEKPNWLIEIIHQASDELSYVFAILSTINDSISMYILNTLF